MITFEDFQKLDIRIGSIVKAEKAEGADKLMKMQVDFGVDAEGKPEGKGGSNQSDKAVTSGDELSAKADKAAKPVIRQIVASIADFYAPEDLVGKQCPFLLNLEPKAFRGHESQGMILAIDVEGDRSDCVLMHPNREVRPGSKVI